MAWFAASGALNLQAGVLLILFAVLAALVILLVIVAVAWGLNPSRQDFAWFIRLRRPRWLVFEGLAHLAGQLERPMDGGFSGAAGVGAGLHACDLP
ncbi:MULTISPECIES: hypothetical protein [Cyanobium]|uniref:hypothetical protein n=1 Tax=Cyanobium TaxID=167375 RepID=UPI001F4E536B|nr:MULTISPECIES: hypothetical protein [Cyanobium]